MGLPKIIQIPCHHVLANQNDLKFKKRAPLKQFFNINLGIGIIKKTTFFCGSGVHQKYAVWVIVGCGIKFCIERALPIEIWVKTQGDMSKIWTKKVVLFMIPIPKFILKNCLTGAPFLNFKEFWLANIWWHGICIIFGRPILNWIFL